VETIFPYSTANKSFLSPNFNDTTTHPLSNSHVEPYHNQNSTENAPLTQTYPPLNLNSQQIILPSDPTTNPPLTATPSPQNQTLSPPTNQPFSPQPSDSSNMTTSPLSNPIYSPQSISPSLTNHSNSHINPSVTSPPNSPVLSYTSSDTLDLAVQSPPPPILKPIVPTHSMNTRGMNGIFKPKQLFSVTKYPIPPSVEPTCVTQALQHVEWKQAMSDEFTALMKNGTWSLVPPQSNYNIIGCKWVFRIKRNTDGSIA
jgi:hypothetical protein